MTTERKAAVVVRGSGRRAKQGLRGAVGLAGGGLRVHVVLVGPAAALALPDAPTAARKALATLALLGQTVSVDPPVAEVRVLLATCDVAEVWS
jgi:hypothetical protein